MVGWPAGPSPRPRSHQRPCRRTGRLPDICQKSNQPFVRKIGQARPAAAMQIFPSSPWGRSSPPPASCCCPQQIHALAVPHGLRSPWPANVQKYTAGRRAEPADRARESVPSQGVQSTRWLLESAIGIPTPRRVNLEKQGKIVLQPTRLECQPSLPRMRQALTGSYLVAEQGVSVSLRLHAEGSERTHADIYHQLSFRAA